MEKIKLVLVDNNTIGYIEPHSPYMVCVLRTKDYYKPQIGRFPINENTEVRLAGKKDFDFIGVSFEPYRNDPAYLHAENNPNL